MVPLLNRPIFNCSEFLFVTCREGMLTINFQKDTARHLMDLLLVMAKCKHQFHFKTTFKSHYYKESWHIVTIMSWATVCIDMACKTNQQSFGHRGNLPQSSSSDLSLQSNSPSHSILFGMQRWSLQRKKLFSVVQVKPCVSAKLNQSNIITQLNQQIVSELPHSDFISLRYCNTDILA